MIISSLWKGSVGANAGDPETGKTVYCCDRSGNIWKETRLSPETD